MQSWVGFGSLSALLFSHMGCAASVGGNREPGQSQFSHYLLYKLNSVAPSIGSSGEGVVGTPVSSSAL